MKETKQSFYQQTESVQEHYKMLAENYDDLWEYSPEFINFIGNKIIEYLELKSTDLLVDLGCGTGIYTKKVRDLANLLNPVVCVDICSKMLGQIPNKRQFKLLNMDARNFTQIPGKYDKIFSKQMLHHVPEDDKKYLIKSLFEKLKFGGIFLIIMLPPTVEYPLFEAALKRYEELEPPYQNLVEILEDTGAITTVDFIEYSVSVEKFKYFQMVQNRYMSMLSTFTDEEINRGINEIAQKFFDYSILNFPERFVFIKGKKSRNY